MSYGDDPIPEAMIDDPSAAGALGYSRSKWVAEQVCHMAATYSHDRRRDMDKSSSSDKDAVGDEQPLDYPCPLRGRVAVFRVGQLAGDSHRGVWNSKEAWPMMLSLVKVTGTLPDLEDETLDWLPVDVAATAFVQGMASAGLISPSNGDGKGRGSDGDLSLIHI